MSNYKDFNHCIICRSDQNFKDYKGKYEVTMLLNTLYMTVMQPVEKRRDLHVKSAPLATWLKENKIVDVHDNDYTSDDIVRYLRNGLAHFNIQVNEDGTEISTVRITANNLRKGPICKQPCKNPKCQPKQFKDYKGSICTFDFSVVQLKEFAQKVINSSLENYPKMECVSCPYSTPKG